MLTDDLPDLLGNALLYIGLQGRYSCALLREHALVAEEGWQVLRVANDLFVKEVPLLQLGRYQLLDLAVAPLH